MYKGKVERYNNYICPGCDILYCESCARAIEGLENACWVCNEPFDPSKQSKPFKKEKLLEDIDIVEKNVK